uniref:Secreted protein n=1 Tax=Anguilla anguilla TaxID=7936 RepID=A0A0E9UEE9_ANGAN
MTAFRRPASFSVWLSSVSSLLGNVVISTNSTAAMAGRALATNSLTSDTLWLWLNFCTSRPPSASRIWMLVTG